MNRTNYPLPLSLTVFSHQGNDSAQKRGAGKWSVGSSGNRTYRLETVSLTWLVQRSGKDWRFSPSISSGRQISRLQVCWSGGRRAEIPEGSHPCKLRGWLEAHKQTHPHTHNEKEVNKRGERCTGGLDNHDTRWHHRNTNFKTSQCNFRKQLLCLVFISSMTVPLTESSPWGWNPLFPNVFSSCLKNQDVSNSSPQFNGYT